MEAAVVTSDDRVIFVSVIYRPTQRFAFFRFKKTRDEVQTELHHFISKRNADLLGSQELIVKGRNQVSTLSERSGAGRVERDLKNDERIVAVAKQDGFGGKMLQTKLLGDTLSTVEYMANEKREMINKWGFWGLIVFVWIPFMASGVSCRCNAWTFVSNEFHACFKRYRSLEVQLLQSHGPTLQKVLSSSCTNTNLRR